MEQAAKRTAASRDMLRAGHEFFGRGNRFCFLRHHSVHNAVTGAGCDFNIDATHDSNVMPDAFTEVTIAASPREDVDAEAERWTILLPISSNGPHYYRLRATQQ